MSCRYAVAVILLFLQCCPAVLAVTVSECTLPKGCAADLADNNGLVNIADLAAVLSLWGSTEVQTQPFICADLNKDQRITIVDLASIISSWGRCPAAPPECPAETRLRVQHDAGAQLGCEPLRVCRVYARIPRGLTFAAARFGTADNAQSGVRTASGPFYQAYAGGGALYPSALAQQLVPMSRCQTFTTVGTANLSSSCPVLSPDANANLTAGFFRASTYCVPGGQQQQIPRPVDCEYLLFQAAIDPSLASGPVTGVLTLFLDDGTAIPRESTHIISCFGNAPPSSSPPPPTAAPPPTALPDICCCIWDVDRECFPGVERSACVPPLGQFCNDSIPATPLPTMTPTMTPTTVTPTMTPTKTPTPVPSHAPTVSPTTASPSKTPSHCGSSASVRVVDSSAGQSLPADLDPRCLSGNWSGVSNWDAFDAPPTFPLHICRVYARLPSETTLVAGRYGDRLLTQSGLRLSQGALHVSPSASVLYPDDVTLQRYPWASCFTYLTQGHSHDASCPQLAPSALTEMNVTAGVVKGAWLCVPGTGAEIPDYESCEILIFQAAIDPTAAGPLVGNVTLILQENGNLDPVISTHEIHCFEAITRGPTAVPAPSPSASPTMDTAGVTASPTTALVTLDCTSGVCNCGNAQICNCLTGTTACYCQNATQCNCADVSGVCDGGRASVVNVGSVGSLYCSSAAVCMVTTPTSGAPVFSPFLLRPKFAIMTFVFVVLIMLH